MKKSNYVLVTINPVYLVFFEKSIAGNTTNKTVGRLSTVGSPRCSNGK